MEKNLFEQRGINMPEGIAPFDVNYNSQQAITNLKVNNDFKVLVLIPPTTETNNVVRDLIVGCWCKGKRIGGATLPPTSQLLLSTIIKDLGVDVTLFDAQGERKSIDDVIAIINQYDYVVMTSSTMSYREDMNTVKELKKHNPNLKSVVAGSHITHAASDAIQNKVIDIFIMGEQDFVIRDFFYALINGQDYRSVSGIAFAQNGDYNYNPANDFIRDMDELPIPDFDLLNRDVEYFNPIVKNYPYTTTESSRGCVGKCTFCTVPVMHGTKGRARSAQKVVEEMIILQEKGFKEIFFRDAMFTTFRKRNLELFELIKKHNVKLSWICSGIIGSVNKEIMLLMQETGCHMIRFGVESGVQEILDNIKKGTKVEKGIDTFRWANEINLDTHGHFMVGMPGDTEETVNETINYAKKLNPTTATFGICTPYPGTPIFNMVKEKYPEIADGSDQTLAKVHNTAYYTKAYTDLEPDRLEYLQRKAYRKFYLRPSYIWKTLKRIRNIPDLRRITIAGSNVAQFATMGD